MNLSNSKIGKKEAIFFILIVSINKIILNLPKLIIKDTSTGAVFNILFTGGIAILLVFFINFLFKRFQNYDIIDISEYLGGKVLKFIISIAYMIFFSIIICTVMLKLINLIKVVYFPKSPYIYIISFFVIGICFANYCGFKSILKANALILPVIIFSLIIIFFGISDNIDVNRLFPIMGDNFKSIFVTGISNIYAYGGITYILFLMPLLKEKKDFLKVSLISIFSSILFLLFVTIALLLTFPFIVESEEIVSMYLLVRVVEFGTFFQRTDALFILLWILSAFSYLSISLMLILNIFKKVTKIQSTRNVSFCFGLLIMSLALLLNNSKILTLLDSTIYKYYIIILVFIVSILILIFANIKKKIMASKPYNSVFKKKSYKAVGYYK